MNGTGEAERSERAMRKVERVSAALHHREADRVPVSDFFWGSFIDRWRDDLNLPDDADPYAHYDLDWIVTTPNMDPHIRPFETVKEDDTEVIVKTGFETTLRKRLDLPMPEQISWDTDSMEKLEAFEPDDPHDPRRYYEAGDNQIAGVGDGFARNSPAWTETVASLRDDYAVFGSMMEVNECLTRLVGQANALLWMGLYPDRMARQISRIGEFYLECAKAEIEAADLDGFVIWGDFAYRKGLFFSPDYWRRHFKPWVKAIVDVCHDAGLDVIYHGCGNVNDVFEDFVEIGVDGYNPVEAKAGMGVVDLRRKYGHGIAFCGGSDIQVWETGDRDKIRREVLRGLNAAKGGGYIFQSDHSVASDVSGQTYDFIIGLLREHGRYPLVLGELDEAGIE